MDDNNGTVDEGRVDREPDAELVVKEPRHGPLIAWRWADGRHTVNPDEHDVLRRLVKKAEQRFEPGDYPSGTVVGVVWMADDDSLHSVSWKEPESKSDA
jgi:hypothetical protein